MYVDLSAFSEKYYLDNKTLNVQENETGYEIRE